MDKVDFVRVYREQLPKIGQYLSRRVPLDEVEDIASLVFEVAWQKRSQVTPGEELPWLYRIAAFQVANFRRRQATFANFLSTTLMPSSAPAAEDLATFDLDLSAAWKSLSSSEQSLLALVAFEGLSVQDAAIATGITANSASTRLHRARKKLAAKLQVQD
jgi:RNA polymerase sigma-70 factor (ECF subfamily)